MSDGAIKWGPERPHDGSAKCPAEARDVACMVRVNGVWFGRVDPWPGVKWTWKHVIAYRLPADVPAPAPAADPVRDALVDVVERAVSLIRATEDGWHQKAAAALALAKGETK